MQKQVIIAITLAFTLLGCWNLTGENQRKAEREAARYIEHLHAAGVDAQFSECMRQDTDGDGYVACVVIVEGQPKTIDCAGKALLVENTGCKDYVPKMRVTTISQPSGDR